MKRKFFLIAVLTLVWAGETFAQFPLKTVREIQEVTDLDSPPPADESPLLGDTVVVRGVVATCVRYYRRPPLLYTGASRRIVL